MDFPDGPVVKTSSFNARIAGLVGELKIPYALRLNIYIYIYIRSNIVTNPLKTLETFHLKTIFKK